LESMKGLKIGFNWQGKPTQSRDALRSIPLELFEPLAKLPNVTLVNLHKGSGESQIEPNRERVPMVVLDDMDNNGPFMDTAAAMKQVDLVISTDTSIVHLAGSMGVPVWVPIATSCDWRFGIDRTDSPWYPSMRLFRQKAFQVWEPVIAEIVDAVRELQRESVTIQSQGADSADDPAMPRLATSIGELVDKITILEIKSERIDDEDKLSNVRRELELLNATRDSCGLDAGIDTLAAELKSVNEKLWDVEDDVRACEDAEDFGDRFVELARSVYKLNDQRSALKRQINEATGSALKEEKSYGAEAEKSA